jgi:monoamine oxidase
MKECEADGVRVLTGKRIRQVDWDAGSATAYTIDNEVFRADKIVITIPAGILQKAVSYASINLTPPVDEYDLAWRHIGYGSVLKIVLVFEKAFWTQDHKDLGFVLSEETIPTWWTQSSAASTVLTGWLGGPAAVQWDVMTDESVVEASVLSLSRIFSMPVDEITGLLASHHIFRWHADHTACGAYTYGLPFSAEARQLLTRPIENTVYFAGEALYDGPSPGTVEAALVSGIDVAERLRQC